MRQSAGSHGHDLRPVPTARAANGLACAAFLAITLSILALAAGPILTDDLWWHVAMGEVYATEGPWPSGGDPLLHTAHEDSPVQHEWLFGVGIFAIERAVGFGGLRAIHALLVVAILGLAVLHFRRAAPAPAAAWAAAAAFAVLGWWRLFQLRPDLTTMLSTLLAAWLLLLRPDPPSSRRLVAYLALLLVWANLHSLFAIGLALHFALLLGLALEALLASAVVAGSLAPARVWQTARQIVPGERARRIGSFALALVLAVLVTLLNPRGIEHHLTFFTMSAETGIWRVQDELTPFDPFSLPAAGWEAQDLAAWVTGQLVLALFAIAVAVAGTRLVRRRNEASLRAFDPVGFGLGLAGVAAMLLAIRLLWLGVFPLLYVLQQLPRSEPCRTRATRASAALAVVFAAAFPFLGSYRIVAGNLPATPGQWLSLPYVAEKHHLEMVRFLRESGLAGNLYNPYVMGGFLDYWVAPRLRTFVDGRTGDYSADVLMDYSNIALRRGSARAPSFLELLDHYEVDVFLGTGVPNDAWRDSLLYTTAHLQGAPGWIPVFRSLRSAVWLRNDARNAENRARVAAFYGRAGVPYRAEQGIDARVLLGEAADRAVERRWLPPDYLELRAALAAGDAARRLRALERVALAHALLGLYEEQVALDREALALAPEAPGPRRRLVYGLLRQGRVPDAFAAVSEWLQVAPRDPRALAAARAVRAYREGGDADGVLDRYPLLDAEELAWLHDPWRGVVLDGGATR